MNSRVKRLYERLRVDKFPIVSESRFIMDSYIQNEGYRQL